MLLSAALAASLPSGGAAGTVGGRATDPLAWSSRGEEAAARSRRALLRLPRPLKGAEGFVGGGNVAAEAFACAAGPVGAGAAGNTQIKGTSTGTTRSALGAGGFAGPAKGCAGRLLAGTPVGLVAAAGSGVSGTLLTPVAAAGVGGQSVGVVGMRLRPDPRPCGMSDVPGPPLAGSGTGAGWKGAVTAGALAACLAAAAAFALGLAPMLLLLFPLLSSLLLLLLSLLLLLLLLLDEDLALALRAFLPVDVAAPMAAPGAADVAFLLPLPPLPPLLPSPPLPVDAAAGVAAAGPAALALLALLRLLPWPSVAAATAAAAAAVAGGDCRSLLALAACPLPPLVALRLWPMSGAAAVAAGCAG